MEARELMLTAAIPKDQDWKINDPSDTGMLFFALTGDQNGTPEKALDYFEASGLFFGDSDVTDDATINPLEVLMANNPQASSTNLEADIGFDASADSLIF